jgi:hypothetical protein
LNLILLKWGARERIKASLVFVFIYKIVVAIEFLLISRTELTIKAIE